MPTPSTRPVDVDADVLVVSTRPVTLTTAPARGAKLQVRVTAPNSGSHLPIIVFSHGFGSSMDSYGPVVDAWAARGYVVIQPTHLDSATLGLAADDPRTPLIWRTRIDDIVHVVDHLGDIEAAVPGLAGRLDHTRIAAAGHSYGATTASAVLGARIIDRYGNVGDDMTDTRFTAGVLFAVAGTGGADLTPFASETFPFMNPDFDHMTAPALIIAGDRDQSALSVRGPDWWRDVYDLSPGDKTLLTLTGAEHSLGGIDADRGAIRSDAERPELIALVRQVTTAYLDRSLRGDDRSWTDVQTTFADGPRSAGRIESK